MDTLYDTSRRMRRKALVLYITIVIDHLLSK